MDDYWLEYMHEYLAWKRDGEPPAAEYKGVETMGGLYPQICEYASHAYGFDPDSAMGGVDFDGAPYGAHPYGAFPRPSCVNWAILRALFWEPWRVTNYLNKEVGRNQAKPGEAVFERFRAEAIANGICG